MQKMVPYSDESSLPTNSSNDTMSRLLTLSETNSPLPHNETTTPLPTSQEQILIEPLLDAVVIQETNRMPDVEASIPCYPTPGDIMPYDHSFPDFIRQITNQPNLANLHSLSLRVISALISLHRMSTYLPNLRELDLEGSVLNSLRDIGCSFKNLQILKVGCCQLESLDGTFGLSSLRELYAQKNFINDVSPCSNLPHIRHIDVSSNRIRNISYAGFLSACTRLKSITFTGNPATEVPDYRKYVRRILPQIEILDGVPFINEDNAEKTKESELRENYCEGSDSSSAGVPDFSSVSPSDSLNNFFESEEDLLHLDKKNKQAKNLANQDQTDNADYETQDISPETVTNLELQDDFQNLNLHQNKVQKEFLEQAKIAENKNISIKQKCARIQKLDKDIENRSKKSNLLLNVDLNEEVSLSSDFSKYTPLEGSSCSPSTSGAIADYSDELRKTLWTGKKSMRPCRASESTYKVSSDIKTKEVKFGTIKKSDESSLSALVKPRSKDQFTDHKWGPSNLTTGLPICGNLTAALRTRKKIQNAWGEKQDYLSQKFEAKIVADANKGRKLEIQINGSGDFSIGDCDLAYEDEMIEKDVLATSMKWKEALHHFKSNNRASWEEEDENNYTNLLRETFDLDYEEIEEENKSSSAR